MSILGNCKERYSSPGDLSHGSPCNPVVVVPLRSARDQESGRLQVAPHKRHARTAKGLDGGVEEEGGEDARVSRQLLDGHL